MRVVLLSLFILLPEVNLNSNQRSVSRVFRRKQLRTDGKEERCYLEDDEAPELQIVFLVDADLPADSNWPIIQREMTRDIMQMTREQHDAEYALTAYHNWRGDGENGDNCYTLLEPFTKDPLKILKTLFALPGNTTDDIHGNCSLTMAVLMTVLDKNLHWDHQLLISGRKTVRKVIITFPLKVSVTHLPASGNRREPLADGTDTCKNSKPPSSETLEWVLVENNVYLYINTFEISGRQFGTTQKFYFQDLFQQYFDHMNGVMDGIPMEPGDASFAYEHDQVESGGFVESSQTQFTLMSGESKACEWEDPPSYNTLGF